MCYNNIKIFVFETKDSNIWVCVDKVCVCVYMCICIKWEKEDAWRDAWWGMKPEQGGEGSTTGMRTGFGRMGKERERRVCGG